MTFDQFIDKWIGKKADFDGAYGGQCVDLARYYWKEVTQTPQPKGVAGAADFWTNYPTDPALNLNFDRISNTPTGVPLKGDIMIWNKNAGGGFGHISMFISGDANGFSSFDQNWPTLSVCTRTSHNYTNVLGWFTLKGNNMALLTYLGVSNEAEATAKLKEHLGELNGKCDWGNADGDRGGFLGSARREINVLNSDLERAKTDLASTSHALEACKVDLTTCQTSTPSPADPAWEVNGKIIETTEGNVKTILNYKKV